MDQLTKECMIVLEEKIDKIAVYISAIFAATCGCLGLIIVSFIFSIIIMVMK